jgi:hypothetical protein
VRVGDDAATNLLFVLGGDGLLLEAIARALAPLGQVLASGRWTELAGPLLAAVRDPRRRLVLVQDLDAPVARGAEFCKAVRKHAPNVLVVAHAGAPWRVAPGIADAVVPRAEGAGGIARAVEVLLAARAVRRLGRPGA